VKPKVVAGTEKEGKAKEVVKDRKFKKLCVTKWNGKDDV